MLGGVRVTVLVGVDVGEDRSVRRAPRIDVEAARRAEEPDSFDYLARSLLNEL